MKTKPQFLFPDEFFLSADLRVSGAGFAENDI